MITFLKRFSNGLQHWLLRLTSYLPSHLLRKSIYRFFGMKIGRNSYIYFGAEIRAPRNIIIGADCIIGHRAILDGCNGITLGNNVNISTGAWFWTMQHDPQSPTFAAVGGPIVIEDNAWVSGRAIVLPNVFIRTGAVVATGSVITKDVEAYQIVGGIPAKSIGVRTRVLSYRLGATSPVPFF